MFQFQPDFHSKLRTIYYEDHPDLNGRVSSSLMIMRDHPFKDFEIGRNCAEHQLAEALPHEVRLEWFEEEATLNLSVKQFCYINGERFLLRDFETDPIDENTDDDCKIRAYAVKTDNRQPDQDEPLFDPEMTQKGLDALDAMIPIPDVDSSCRWLCFLLASCIGCCKPHSETWLSLKRVLCFILFGANFLISLAVMNIFCDTSW